MKSLYSFVSRVESASNVKLSESVATNRTISLSSSTLFLKSIALSLAMLVVGIGSSWGQNFSVVGSGTAGSGASYANPYNNGYWGNKTQQFVTAAQLTASGVAANASISQLGFNVTTAGTGTAANLSGFTIKVYTTASTDPLTAWVTATLVAQSTPVTLDVGTTGWKMTSLQSAFVWNGTSNLVIETCYNNNSWVAGCAVQWTTTGLGTGTWSRWYRADASTVCSSTLVTGTSTTSRPNIRFAWCPPAPSCPTLSAPVDLSTGVSLTPTLSWTAGTNTANYDVYLSTNQTDVNNQAAIARVSTSQVSTSYTSAALSPSTVYYWRIVPKNSCGTAATGCTTRSFTTAAPSPTISQSGTLSAFSACANIASAQQSFTVSGIYLSGNLVVTAPTGFSVSTTSGSGWASSVSLTPSSGTVSSTTIYVRMNALASNPTAANIVCSSISASSVNVAVSGSVIAGPTVDAGSDFNICSGQTVAMNASTNAVGPTLSGTANSGTVTISGTDSANPTATYTFTGLPSGAVINGITVNISSAGGANCPSWYSVTTRLNNVQQGAAGCATNTTYNNLNGQAANGLVVAVRGQDNDAYGDAMTITYTATLNYTYVGSPTYAWSPATALSATNVLNPNCSATSTQTYTLTVTGGNGCSASDQVVATVAGSAPLAPTASVSGASTINVGGTATLTSSAGANTLWYTVAAGGSSVASGDNWQTPVQCVSGTKTYYAENNDGTCASATRTAVTFTVRPMVLSNPENALICQSGGSVALSTQLTGGSSITWSPSTNLSTTSGSSTVASPTTTTIYTMNATVTGCGAVSGTKTVGVIDAVAFTPTSTPTEVCAGNPAVLASNLSSSNFSVSSATFSPLTPPGSGVTNLVDGSTGSAVSLSGGNFDDGGWGGIPIGFNYNFFGQSFSDLAVGTNGLVMFGTVPGYDATAGNLGQFSFNTVGGAFPNANNPGNVIALLAHDANMSNYNTNTRVRYWTQGIAPTRKFVLDFVAMPTYATPATFSTAQLVLNETTGIVEIYVTTAPAGTGNSAKIIGLQNGAKTIGAVAGPNNATPEWNYRTTAASNLGYKFTPGANYTFQWATAGSNISGANSTGYTTPNLSTAGTVTYTVAATNPNTQCTTTQSVSVTVNALPAAPNSTGDVTACSTAGNQALTVSTGVGETADWFATSTGGTVLASGDNVLSYSTATAGTYYAAAQNTTTGCSSASRTGVTLNVNAAPAAPTVTTPVSYCQGSTATALTATATGANTLNWYSAAPSYPSFAGATALGSAPTPSTLNEGTTNFYVSQSSSSNSCESQLALIAVTVNATPSAPVASNPAPYCQGATASALTATSTTGNTLYWYTVPTGGTGSSIAPTPSTTAAGSTDYYVANRSDATGCEGPRTTVTVTVNPTIMASVSNSASSTSACGGGSITFTATPTNGGTPTYQWYLEGVAVSGETGSTYTLVSPADGDDIYVEMTPSAQTCLASNAATASNTVTLTNTAATPTVSIQSSASTAFCPGTSVTFSVNSSANMGATPSYQWNLNGTPINGATNATLVTTSLANNDQVTLTMTSSLSAGCLTQSSATSSSITSTVNSATAISTQPAAAAACLGGSASFTVSATGTGSLTYQWKKNGSNVTGNATATSSTLTLSGIAAGDAANYTVDVTGTCGTVTSGAAGLTINPATAISTQPSAASVCAGATVNFSVIASGQGTLTYQWRKDGSALSGETNATLAVTNISAANAGQYSVIVSGGCGNVTSSNALLAINAATVISTQPGASTLCAGNTANFSVTASGTGTLSYQWKKDGLNVGTNSSSLSVANAQAANAGTYTVDVTGSCGTVTSSTALLTVNPITTITTQPVSTLGCQGQTSSFTVIAAGTSPLAYQWKFGGVNISGATSATYNITNASAANDGSYSVTVTGGCGLPVNSNTVVLDVSPTSVAGTVGSNQTICSGNSPAGLTLIGNTGTIQWQSSSDNSTFVNIDGAVASPLTSAQIGTLNATTYYRAIVTSGSCSSATTNTVQVTVNPLPTAVTVSGGGAICAGTSATLTASNGSSGTIYWQNTTAGGTSTATPSVSQSVSAAGTYYFRPRSAAGCWGTQGSATVTINPLPTASVAATSPICSGNNATFTITGTSGASVSYSINGTAGTATLTGGSATVTVNNATSNQTITLSSVTNNTTSCTQSLSASATVVVNALPTASISASGATTFCAGGSVTLTASTGTSYAWSNGATSQAIIVSASGDYSVTVTNGNNCTASSSSTAIVVNALPTAVTVSGGGAICAGTSATLTASNGSSGTIYWQNTTAGGTSTATPSASQSVSAAGTYYFRPQSQAGCWGTEGSATVTVTSLPSTPVVTVVDNCNGTSTLSTAATGTLLWSTTETTSPITVSTAGTYTVTQTANGCTSAAGSGVAAPKSTPATPSITVTNSCGQSTLSFTPATNATILWSNNATTSSTTTTSSETLTVVQTVNGCSSAAGSGSALPLVIPSAPTATASQNFCVTDNATVGSLAYTSVAGNTYTWYDAATAGNTVATSTQLPTATTTYYLSTTGSNGCTSTTRTAVSATEALQALASVTITGGNSCPGTAVTFTATPTNGGNSPTYQWYNGGVPITGETGNTYTATGLAEGAVITVKMIPSGSCVTVCP